MNRRELLEKTGAAGLAAVVPVRVVPVDHPESMGPHHETLGEPGVVTIEVDLRGPQRSWERRVERISNFTDVVRPLAFADDLRFPDTPQFRALKKRGGYIGELPGNTRLYLERYWNERKKEWVVTYLGEEPR